MFHRAVNKYRAEYHQHNIERAYRYSILSENTNHFSYKLKLSGVTAWDHTHALDPYQLVTLDEKESSFTLFIYVTEWMDCFQ